MILCAFFIFIVVLFRIGQKSKDVKLVYLLARNTADDVVWDQIQRKYSVLGATVGEFQIEDLED